MGYVLTKEGFEQTMSELQKTYRIYAPVRKVGAGRFTDTDAVIYEEVENIEEIEFHAKSDYSAKEILTPLSETLFFFTEDQCTEAKLNTKPVLVFLRSCDLHAIQRMDQIYLENGREEDWFYARRRDLVKFVLMGCECSFENCFCVDMKSNISEDGYVFSVDEKDGEVRINVREESMKACFEQNAASQEEVIPAHVTENQVHVRIPENIPQESMKAPLWDEYTSRCIGCGRCNFVCPSCTCFTMQDAYYTDNGKVGERRRVGASCMVDGYTNVAGGGQYRRTQGERMRFKVLHKIVDFRKRFGYDMCVGCGRCDDVCPEYISYTNIINKVADACDALASKEGEQ